MTLDGILEAKREDMVRALVGVLKIPSVKGEALPGAPFGAGPAFALHYALGLCRGLGLETKNLDNYVGYAHLGPTDSFVGVMVHLDVVPAGDGWTHPPYSGIVDGGRVYGRGAQDDKGPFISALYAIAALREAGVPLKRGIRLIMGCDEESGMTDIPYYAKHEPLPVMAFSPDTSYPIINIEKNMLTIAIRQQFGKTGNGLVLISVNGGERANIVPDIATAVLEAQSAEEARKTADALAAMPDIEATCEGVRINVTARGKMAHASSPQDGKNALGVLAVALSKLDAPKENGLAFLTMIAETIGSTYDGSGFGIAQSDEASGKLTLNLGILNLDEKGAEAVIDIRHPISSTKEDLFSAIDKTIRKYGAEAGMLHSSPGHHIPENEFLIQSLKKAYEDKTGQKAYCMAVGGGTYARTIPNAVAFGPVFPGKQALAHHRDEHIEIDEIVLNAKIYAAALAMLAGE